MSRLRKLLLCLLPILIGNGCCGTREYTLALQADPGLVANTSIKVDVNGVTDAELEQWRNRDLSAYQTGPDVFEMNFGQGRPAEQALAIDDALWQRWFARKVTHLYVVALIPGVQANGLGPADPRVVELPLDHCRWADSPSLLRVSLHGTGLRVETAAANK